MFLLSFCFCLAVHVALERAARLPFATAFKIGRGVASLGMTAIGFYAIARYVALLPRCYVAHQDDDATARALVMVIIGHFVADFVLVGRGLLGRVRARPDLVIHHALGLFAAAQVLRLGAGHALYLALFTTEMMPVTTAVGALGAAIGRPGWERISQALRLAVLLVWRIPLWLAIAWLVWKNLDAGPADAVLRAVYYFSASFLVVTLSLDTFWTYKSWRALRRAAPAAEAKVSLRRSALLVLGALLLAPTARADISIPSPRPKAPRATEKARGRAAACGLLARFVGPAESEDALEALGARVERIADDDPAKEPAVRDLLRRYRDRYLRFDAEYWDAVRDEARAASGAPLRREARLALDRRRDRAAVHASEWLKRAVREHVAWVDDAAHDAAPGLDEALFWLAEMLIAQGRDDLAEPAIARLERASPRSPWMRWVHLLLGETALARGNRAAALAHFESVIGAGEADDVAACARAGTEALAPPPATR